MFGEVVGGGGGGGGGSDVNGWLKHKDSDVVLWNIHLLHLFLYV